MATRELPPCGADGCEHLADPRWYIHAQDKRSAIMACDGHGNPGCAGLDSCTCPAAKKQIIKEIDRLATSHGMTRSGCSGEATE